jgi:hypothetical protein
MMMTMIRRIYLVLFCFGLSMVALAQEKDFGIWYGVSAEHKLGKKFELDLSTDVRTYKNASKIELAYLEGGLSYDLSKYFSTTASYRLTKSIENDDAYYYQHKFFLEFQGKLPVNNLIFTGSARFQARTKTYIKDSEDGNADYSGKLRLKALYKTSSFLRPYVYSEVFLPMFSDQNGAGKVRYSAGMEFRITKNNSIETEYIYQRDYLPHLSDMNIISLNYNIKF